MMINDGGGEEKEKEMKDIHSFELQSVHRLVTIVV